MDVLMKTRAFRITALAAMILLCAGAALAAQPSGQTILLPPPDHPTLIPPAGGILGFQHGLGGETARLGSLAHIHGIRVNHLLGHGLVVGLQNTGDTQETLFSIEFLLNMLRHGQVTLPASLNPINIQTRNLAAVMVTADLPPFARTGSRIGVLVSALGDARSLQGGTLLMTPLRGADGRVYALAQGPLTMAGFFTGGSGGAAVKKNFQTAGSIPGGATVEREVRENFAASGSVEIELDHPDAALAENAAGAIGRRFKQSQVAVMDPGTLKVTLPPWISPVQFVAQVERLPVMVNDSDRIIVDERTGTVVVGGEVTVGEAAVSHGNLTVTIQPELMVSQPGAFSNGTTVSQKTAKITVSQSPGQFFMVPRGASVAQIAETLNAVGTKPDDVVAIFEALSEAGALHGHLIVQ
jgi:flagellar P-ring protein precursor FlgI